MKITAKQAPVRVVAQNAVLANKKAPAKQLPPAVSPAGPSGPSNPSRALKEIYRLHTVADNVASSVGKVDGYLNTMFDLFEKAASGNRSAADLSAIDAQFQSTLKMINRLANRPINGFGALNGSGKVDAGAIAVLKPYLFDQKVNQPLASEALLKPGALSAVGLFGNTDMSLQDRDNIGSIYEALQSARQVMRGAKEEVAGFKAALVYAENNAQGRKNTGPAFHEVAFADKASETLNAVHGQVEMLHHVLDQALALATQSASGSTSDIERSFMNQELQALLQHNNLIVKNSKSFDGKPLFDGTYQLNLIPELERFVFTGSERQPTADQARLVMQSLTNEAVFNGAQPSVATQQDAVQTIERITQAKAKLSSVENEVMDFALALQFARSNMAMGTLQMQSLKNFTPPAKLLPPTLSDMRLDVSTGVGLGVAFVPEQGKTQAEGITLLPGPFSGINILV